MGGKRFRAKAMRAQKVHISLLPLATLVSPILGRQPGLGRRYRGPWSRCPGSRCSWSHHPRCSQRRPTKAGGGGKHLERISLEQGSLAVFLVAPLTVAVAATVASLSTTMVSTATSRTREDLTTRADSTAKALTRTRASTTRTTDAANATTA